MAIQPDYHTLIKPLANLITRFLNGEWTYVEFQREFQPALKSYEKAIKDRAYSPLDVVADVPRHCVPKLLSKRWSDCPKRLWIGQLVSGSLTL